MAGAKKAKAKQVKAKQANKPLTPKKLQRFLALLSEYGNVSRAADEAGVHRVHMYQVRARDEEFAADWDEAARIGAARLEDEARRRAVEGWDEPVWHKGIQCGTTRKYSDTLLICLLKAHHPEKYAERSKNELTGADGGPLTVEVVSFADSDSK
jgi:hypothetical protein